MDLSITYTNHLGDVVRIADGGHLHLLETSLLDHRWEYKSDGQRIWGLRLGARKFELPIGMLGGSLAERTELYRALEADAVAAELGTLGFQGYSLICLPVATSLAAWWFSDGIEERAVEFVAPRPLWTREVVSRFPIVVADERDAVDLDHPHDYAHDWKRGASTARSIMVDTVGPAEFRLIVYGPASNPFVVVGGNRYQVDVAVPAGSRLELDTRDRTVRLVGAFGDVTNCYDQRVRGRRGGGSYAFQPLPRGISDVQCDNTFGFDVMVHDERTEPAWVR